jgi:AraC family transcriptional activator of tynA and feaB
MPIVLVLKCLLDGGAYGAKWPIDIKNVNSVDFSARLDNLNLGPLVLTQFETRPAVISRQIQSAEGLFHTLHLLQRGKIRIQHNDRLTLLTEGESVLADSSKHSLVEFVEESSVLSIRVPTSLLRHYVPDPSFHANAKISDRDLNIALQSMFKSLWNHALSRDYRDCSNIRIQAFLGVARAAIKSTGDSPVRPPPDLLGCIKAYINDHLSDQDMSQSSIASHFRISTRYLRKLFSTDPIVSPSRFIRTQRLNKFMSELAILSNDCPNTITNLALSNGFRSVGSFNRVFKEINGVSPTVFLRSCKS